MQHMRILIVALVMFSLAGAKDLLAYEGGSVSNGGTIEGVVKFKGTAPPPKKIQVSKDTAVCGKTAKSDETVVVNNGDIENAVVSTVRDGLRYSQKSQWTKTTGCVYEMSVIQACENVPAAVPNYRRSVPKRARQASTRTSAK